MTHKPMDPFEWIVSAEGQAEIARRRAEDQKRWHAARFRRDADNHDRRIPHAVRVTVLTRANEHCELCGEFYATGFGGGLELHHVTYKRAYGEELPEDLQVLCRSCHQQMPRW